jgi:hypothetical protein
MHTSHNGQLRSAKNSIEIKVGDLKLLLKLFLSQKRSLRLGSVLGHNLSPYEDPYKKDRLVKEIPGFHEFPRGCVMGTGAKLSSQAGAKIESGPQLLKARRRHKSTPNLECCGAKLSINFTGSFGNQANPDWHVSCPPANQTGYCTNENERPLCSRMRYPYLARKSG